MATPEEVTSYLTSDGPLKTLLPTFEERTSQIKMAEDVTTAFREKSIALIEAATGTGKSLAYLLPAVLYALETGERILITTKTIALQQQILQKEIPLISKLIGRPVKAVLVKGMGNYLCLRKMEDTLQTASLFNDDDLETLQEIETWSRKTKDGSKSDLPVIASSSTWEKVACESESCSYAKCPYYQECFFFNAREKAKQADLMIANHHLLSADLAVKLDQEGEEGGGVLPPYSHLIVDEAHHLEDVASEFFSKSVSRTAILKTLGAIATEKEPTKTGKLQLLKGQLVKAMGTHSSDSLKALYKRVADELPLLRKELLLHMNVFFDQLALFYEQVFRKNDDGRVRLKKEFRTHPNWKELEEEGKSFARELSGFARKIEEVVKETKQESLNDLDGTLFDLKAHAGRLVKFSEVIHEILDRDEAEEEVFWLDRKEIHGFVHISMNISYLNIADDLKRILFSEMKTSVLLSATLATESNFSFMKERLGIDASLGKEVIERIYPSPFNYKKQALLFVTNQFPEPSHPDFLKRATASILDSIRASRGGAFVLFTSYSMMHAVYRQVEEQLTKEKYSLFLQGSGDRTSLLNDYLSKTKPVLFGTDSFWEGIDVAGDKLRLVILVKLPFRAPSDPIFSAKSEWVTRGGGDSFRQLALPIATLKFKQGFGRLIRNRKDRGAVVVLDPRITKKSYGRTFLNSLPEIALASDDRLGLKETLTEFYKSRR